MKNSKLNPCKWIVIFFTLVMCQSTLAQGLLDSLAQDDNKIVSSIAPYSPELRSAILNVSQYPQVLVKLERTQARTSQSFQDMVGSYPREEQEKFYQASRFPELTSQLVAIGNGKVEQAKQLAKEYPEGTQQAILDVYQNHFVDLVKINSIYQDSEHTLERVTAKYTPQLQSDFKKVVESPDVMTLLTDNIDLTVSLGDSYKADPQGVIQNLDKLNAQINDQNSKDLASYKTAVESDPKLQAEMKNAADEFAKQYDQQDTNPTTMNNNYYGAAPYPYWFGYPYWYGSPMWYPTPFYYNTGFYLGMNGAMVVFGLPSFTYSNWFFGYGYNRYPLMYNHYNTYYHINRANIARENVYRGFNTVARNHFNAVNRGGNSRSNPATRQPEIKTGNAVNRSSNTGRTFQQGIHSGSFNNNSFNHFNANSFHSMGWQNMRGGGGGGMMRGGRH